MRALAALVRASWRRDFPKLPDDFELNASQRAVMWLFWGFNLVLCVGYVGAWFGALHGADAVLVAGVWLYMYAEFRRGGEPQWR